jgi:hypothetical protein
MAAAAPIVGLAATGFSALGSFEGASKAAQGDQFEAKNAANAAQIGQTKAAETDADMRRKLTSQLSNITAIRAGAGLDPNSPTGAAISANVQGVADLSRTQAVQNIQNQVTSDENASAFYTSSASSALMGGELGAFGSIIGGIAGAMGGKNGLLGQGGTGLGGLFSGIGGI